MPSLRRARDVRCWALASLWTIGVRWRWDGLRDWAEPRLYAAVLRERA